MADQPKINLASRRAETPNTKQTSTKRMKAEEFPDFRTFVQKAKSEESKEYNLDEYNWKYFTKLGLRYFRSPKHVLNIFQTTICAYSYARN